MNRVLSTTLTLVAAGFALVACGSAADAACDDYAKYCGLSSDHAKVTLCRSETKSATCGAEATDWLRCQLDNGAKCNNASELSDTDSSRAACGAKREAYSTCAPAPSTAATAPATGLPVAPVAPPASGALGGVRFSLGSAIFYRSNGKLNFLLGSVTDMCGQLAARRIAVGSLQLEIYDVSADGPGRYKSPRASGVHVKASCPAGAKVGNSDLAFFQEATNADLQLTSVTADRVDGIVDISFPDGSTVVGSFSAALCASLPKDGPICQ